MSWLDFVISAKRLFHLVYVWKIGREKNMYTIPWNIDILVFMLQLLFNEEKSSGHWDLYTDQSGTEESVLASSPEAAGPVHGGHQPGAGSVPGDQLLKFVLKPPLRRLTSAGNGSQVSECCAAQTVSDMRRSPRVACDAIICKEQECEFRGGH